MEFILDEVYFRWRLFEGVFEIRFIWYNVYLRCCLFEMLFIWDAAYLGCCLFESCLFGSLFCNRVVSLCSYDVVDLWRSWFMTQLICDVVDLWRSWFVTELICVGGVLWRRIFVMELMRQLFCDGVVLWQIDLCRGYLWRNWFKM